jgi:hypothetical protein
MFIVMIEKRGYIAVIFDLGDRHRFRLLTPAIGSTSFDMASVVTSPPPDRLLKPMVEFSVDRLVLGAGPGNMSPRVLAACSLPQVSATPTELQIVEVCHLIVAIVPQSESIKHICLQGRC